MDQLTYEVLTHDPVQRLEWQLPLQDPQLWHAACLAKGMNHNIPTDWSLSLMYPATPSDDACSWSGCPYRRPPWTP